jgi:hypothetical protein
MATLFREPTASPTSWRPCRRSASSLFLAHGNDATAELGIIGIDPFLEQRLAELFGIDGLALDAQLLQEAPSARDELGMACTSFPEQLFAQGFLSRAGLGRPAANCSLGFGPVLARIAFPLPRLFHWRRHGFLLGAFGPSARCRPGRRTSWPAFLALRN